MDTRMKRDLTGVWLSLIILLGLGLRLAGWAWGQGYFYFGQGDGIEAYSVAVDYGRGDERAQYLGQPNYNTHSKLPGPLWTMFCFNALRVGRSIEAVLVAVLLLNTAAIWLTWLLAVRTLGKQTALWAALFMSTLPWVVYYSTGVYNPEVMSFLSGLLLLVLWGAINRDRAAVIFWVPVILLMLPQFHMSGLMLIPAVITALALAPVRLSYPWLAGGVLTGLALYVPYLRGEAAHSWQNTHGMFSGGGGYSWDGLKALSAPLSFLVNWAPRWTRSVAEYRELGRACFGSFVVFLAVNIVSAVFAAFVLAGAFKNVRAAMAGFLTGPRKAFQKDPGLLFLTILTVVPLLCALVSGKSFHTRYCIVLLPAFLSLSASGAYTWSRGPRFRGVFLALVAVTTCANLWLMPAMYRHQAALIEKGEVFVPSFRKLETVYQALKSKAGQGRRIRVEDSVYLAALPKGDQRLRDALLLRRYVSVREKEAAMVAPEATGRPVVFVLHAAKDAPGEKQDTAWSGNGILLTAVRDSDFP